LEDSSHYIGDVIEIASIKGQTAMPLQKKLGGKEGRKNISNLSIKNK
jgi:hypothetical protein